MNYNVICVIIFQLSAILVSSISVLGFIHYRETPYARPFSYLMAFSGIYSFTYSIEILGSTSDWIFMWIRFEYLAVPMIGVCWLWFACVYAGYDKYPGFNRFIHILFGISITFTLIVWTNPWHQSYYTSISIDSSGLFPVAHLEKGILYYIHFLWRFMTFLGSTIIFWVYYIRTTALYKKQVKLMGLLSFCILVGISIDISHYVPFQTAIDLGPLLITLFSIVGVTIIYRTNLLQLSPIARERVFESMEDGVIVTTQDGLIADMNAQIKAIIPPISNAWIGRSVFALEPRLQRYDKQNLDKSEEPFIQIIDGVEHIYDVRRVSIDNTAGECMGQAWYFRHITEEHRFLETMINYAEKDALTGVWNRRKWMELARREIYLAARYQQDATVMIIDIDFFKRVNDSFGHAAGDYILQEVTHTIDEQIRGCDIFGRIGGEEFALLFPNTNKQEAQKLSERLLQSVEAQIFDIEGKRVQITLSGGIASNQQGHIDDIQSLLLEADRGLYEAKNNGRNRVVVVV